ncbi:hypothetical protein F6X40_09965 [Paraburkholderia sp. UCT31]|uniref:hypothetical protein n=1 Tax=Paraburkholderia sp. UCT31 TaxID=2615209 RepID=UPI00165589FC|nr:hypothetical protein [Paraburkholderia sp. UCT31]MBC8737132.1 hypothetical protein [Paraburkholderia sp. UCT31]
MPNLTNTMICWKPQGEAWLQKWPDVCDRVAGAFTSGACYRDVRQMSEADRKALVFIEAVHMMVRDGVEPSVVHRALLPLEEYQAGLADDMPL